MLRASSLFVIATLLAGPAAAQVPNLTLRGSLVFYADDTEFSNPFRTGETIIGTYGVVFLEAALSERLTVRAGGFGNWKFGSSKPVDQAKPVLALVVRDGHQQFIFGTLDTTRYFSRMGSDRAGPHGLLPPMERDSLPLERPHESGIQWMVDSERLTQDAWINWQRVNTRLQREIFDAGYHSITRFRPALAMRADIHIVHRGGQKGGIEPVADSSAAAAGLIASGPVGNLDRLTLEINALGSRHVPDRAKPDLSRWGFATFLRASIEDGPWRGHLILWRADDFIKVDGDALYMAVFRDGTHYRGVRDYMELGLTRRFLLAKDSFLETTARFHRTENNYEVSFRILGVVDLNVPLHKK